MNKPTSILTVNILNDSSSDDIRSPPTPTFKPSFSTSQDLTEFQYEKYFDAPEMPLLLHSSSAPECTDETPPPKPIPWIWRCHLCNQKYSLGVTNRCLNDGHYYCDGRAQRNVKKCKREKSCISEFDYMRWAEWMRWRRKNNPSDQGIQYDGKELQGCELCEYPSQCRHEPPMISPSSSAPVLSLLALSAAKRAAARKEVGESASEKAVGNVVELEKRLQRLLSGGGRVYR